ncbi:MAG: acyl-CoA dehydrogenase family protein [Burkholderiales bacterium]
MNAFVDATHEVTNQPPPLVGYNAWTGDRVLAAAVRRARADWVAPQAHALGELAGSERMQLLADQANRYGPVLRSHDRVGHRIDAVEFHPAYHELMGLAFGAGLHSLAWTAKRDGAFAARAALNYLWNQGEQGISCPVTMTFAGVKILRNAPALSAQWEPKLTANAYDARPLPAAQKAGATIGMAMTEKQGGSDLRSNSTVAVRDGDAFLLTGHKWFCSAPMCDAFLALARLDDRVTCFLVPRSLPDGTRNPFYLQRLKDKIGNRSNASSEIEFRNTRAFLVGPEGRGIATLIEMAHLTRFDIVVASAGMMRAGLTQALHHCEHREAFGRLLVEHAAMQNVLADLALESEAATLLAFRLAEAFDRGAADANERLLARIMTPIAKYWLCKRNPPFTVEAMECLGGNGFVEDGPFGRLFRESPLNGIWEGSGNVICLDVLRSAEREPESIAALLAEIRAAAPENAQLKAALGRLEREFADRSNLESRARRLVELAATALQASLMLRHAEAGAAGAFCASRLGGDWGHVFGTLPAGTDCAALAERLRLQ